MHQDTPAPRETFPLSPFLPPFPPHPPPTPHPQIVWPLCLAPLQFSEASYWNARYDQDQKVFEWYRGYRSLAPILELHLPMDRPVLQVRAAVGPLAHSPHDPTWHSLQTPALLPPHRPPKLVMVTGPRAPPAAPMGPVLHSRPLQPSHACTLSWAGRWVWARLIFKSTCSKRATRAWSALTM